MVMLRLQMIATPIQRRITRVTILISSVTHNRCNNSTCSRVCSHSNSKGTCSTCKTLMVSNSSSNTIHMLKSNNSRWVDRCGVSSVLVTRTNTVTTTNSTTHISSRIRTLNSSTSSNTIRIRPACLVSNTRPKIHSWDNSNPTCLNSSKDIGRTHIRPTVTTICLVDKNLENVEIKKAPFGAFFYEMKLEFQSC